MMRSSCMEPAQALTLDGLFRERLRLTPQATAYKYYHRRRKAWCESSWQDMADEICRWQYAMRAEGLMPGDRVAVMLPNSREWVIFDQAALGLGLVTVPLYTNDRPDNVAYIVADAGVKLLVLQGHRQWRQLAQVSDGLPSLRRIISLEHMQDSRSDGQQRVVALREWLHDRDGPLHSGDGDSQRLATIVYTSGTTGRPKGVMLSHGSIVENAYAASRCVSFFTDDLFLSFLPLSHALERTGGYYLPMMVGAQVAFARSVQQLGEDLQRVRPTVLISVPRIYEVFQARIGSAIQGKPVIARWLFKLTKAIGWRRFEYLQQRARWFPGLLLWPLLESRVAAPVTAALGGRLRLAICGGAALPPAVARLFIGLGVSLYQGYGMTEAGPVVSVNRPEDNLPASIGTALPGVEVKVGDNDELLVRSVSIMQGYWNNPRASAEAIDEQGWLHTGDQGRVEPKGHIFITGRLKEIIVLANGEKVSPADMEMVIAEDPLIEQVMVVGEGRPFLSALAVLSESLFQGLADQLGLDTRDANALENGPLEKAVLERMRVCLHAFPGYAQIRRVHLSLRPWTVEEGFLTPTQKLKRVQIQQFNEAEIEAMYEGY